MEIKLQISNILSEIKQKSHFSARPVKDPELKLDARVGEEHSDEVERCLLEAHAELTQLCNRWLNGAVEPEASDSLGTADYFRYDLLLTSRKGAGKGTSIAMGMHAFLVAATLAKFYSTVSNPDLEKEYVLRKTGCTTELLNLLHSKIPPKI